MTSTTSTIAIFQNKEDAVKLVESRVAAGEYSIEKIESLGLVWLHPNPDMTAEQDSVCGTSKEEVIELYATVCAQSIGYDWAFE